MRLRNLRLVDLFTSLDKDASKTLTRKEFMDGLLVRNFYSAWWGQWLCGSKERAELEEELSVLWPNDLSCIQASGDSITSRLELRRAYGSYRGSILQIYVCDYVEMENDDDDNASIIATFNVWQTSLKENQMRTCWGRRELSRSGNARRVSID